MSSQDMQFADPEWQPPEEREVNANTRERETLPPRPINTERREQPQWQTAPPPAQGYLGQGYAGPQPQPQTTWRGASRPMPRRRGSPWLWIIFAFIIIALMSGGLTRGFGGRGGFGPPNSFVEQPQGPQVIKVTGTPTIEIKGGVGDINVSTGGSSNQVTIQATGNGGGPFGNPRDVNINPVQNGNTITLNVDQGGNSDVGLDVTVPTDTNLQLTTTDGAIEVDGFNGQMTLQTNTGSITANNDVLTGSSFLKSDSGSVTFSGSIGSGNYQFQSNSDSVDVTLPIASNFHVDASTNSGSISSDFSSVKGNSTEARGDVGGNPSQAKVTLRSDSGDITLHES